MTKLAPEWVRTSDPVIRSPARYRWTTAPASVRKVNLAPHRYERNCIHIETTANISLFVVQYLRCDGRKARLQ